MSNSNLCRRLTALLMCFTSWSAFSGTMGEMNDNLLSSFSLIKARGHVAVQLGGYSSYQGQSQHVNIDGLIGDTFNVTRHSGTNGLAGIGYFIDGMEHDKYQFLWGVNTFYLAKTSVEGTVTQENLFTNLAYSYTVQHFPLYAMAKALIKTMYPDHTLVLDVGIGPNFMNTKGFSERPLDDITLPDHIFAGKSSTTFSATASAAVRSNLVLGSAPVEFGYRFFYLGEGKFNALSNQVVNTLKAGTSYGNALFVSIVA